MDVVLDDRRIDLVEESIDIAVRMGSMSDTAMTAVKLATTTRQVLGTPAYFARHGVPATPADLARHKAVIYAQPGGGDSWSFRQGATEVSVSVCGPLRVSAAEGVRAGVLADMGLSVASTWMFSPELATGAVQAVLADWSLPPIDLWAVYPAGRLRSAKARAFANFLATALRQTHSRAE
jgi:DNA-binding transcriptional LysR family regulator